MNSISRMLPAPSFTLPTSVPLERSDFSIICFISKTSRSRVSGDLSGSKTKRRVPSISALAAAASPPAKRALISAWNVQFMP